MDINNYISSGVIEQYVMGLCTIEEKNELELLRLEYPLLNEAIVNFELALENKIMKDVLLPGTSTDNKILQSINSLSTPVVPINSKNKTAGIRWLKAVAAAAVLLLGVSAIFNYSLFNKNKIQQQQLALANDKPVTLPAQDYNILKDPAITPVAMMGVGYHAICRCTMFWDKKTGKAYIMIHHLIRSSDTKDYQLWAVVNDKPVNVGMINDSIRDRFIEMNNVPENATEFIVTLEKAGGTTSPTLEETYLKGRI